MYIHVRVFSPCEKTVISKCILNEEIRQYSEKKQGQSKKIISFTCLYKIGYLTQYKLQWHYRLLPLEALLLPHPVKVDEYAL